MKLAKTLTTALSAGALTLVAAGTALAVNIGILNHHADPGVGALDAVAAADASPQYVYVNLNDPAQVSSALNQATQQQATSTPASSLVSTGGHEYEGAQYDD